MDTTRTRSPERRPSRRAIAAALALSLALSLATLLGGCGITGGAVKDEAADYLEQQSERAQAEACYATQRMIEAGMHLYESKTASLPVSLDQLMEEKVLPTIPECPSGGTFTYDWEHSRVSCSVHGEAPEKE